MKQSPKIATIGMFDGVHSGDRFVIELLKKHFHLRYSHFQTTR